MRTRRAPHRRARGRPATTSGAACSWRNPPVEHVAHEPPSTRTRGSPRCPTSASLGRGSPWACPRCVGELRRTAETWPLVRERIDGRRKANPWRASSTSRPRPWRSSRSWRSVRRPVATAPSEVPVVAGVPTCPAVSLTRVGERHSAVEATNNGGTWDLTRAVWDENAPDPIEYPVRSDAWTKGCVLGAPSTATSLATRPATSGTTAKAAGR